MSASDRVTVAERLFDALDEQGSIPLGVLTDDDECVLDNGIWALFDTGAWLRWTAAHDADRAARARSAVASLLERGYAEGVEERDDSYQITLSAPLGIVEAARRRRRRCWPPRCTASWTR